MTRPEDLPVTAAIPNYNMGSSLAELLPQVLKQGYNAVYVLDDGSTDGSKEIVAQFAPEVTWVGSKVNTGAGAARNRILLAHKGECIIHFLDADIRLESENCAIKVRHMMRAPRTAFVGGVVKDPDGRYSLWNHGPNSVTLYTTLTANVQGFFGHVQAPEPFWRNTIRMATKRARSEWPDPSVAPKRRAVFWPVEGNLLVRRSTLEQLGGFDPTVCEYDIIPPARRAYETGLVSYFDPEIVVQHLKINVRHYNRPAALVREMRILIKRYGGWREWIWPEGSFKPRHNA